MCFQRFLPRLRHARPFFGRLSPPQPYWLELQRLFLRPLPGNRSSGLPRTSSRPNAPRTGFASSSTILFGAAASNCPSNAGVSPGRAISHTAQTEPHHTLTSPISFHRSCQRQHPVRPHRRTGHSVTTNTHTCGKDSPQVRLSQRSALSSPLGHWLFTRAHRTSLCARPH